MKLLLIFALLSSILLTSDAAATEHGTEVDEMKLKLDLLSERVQTLEDKIKTCICVSDKDTQSYQKSSFKDLKNSERKWHTKRDAEELRSPDRRAAPQFNLNAYVIEVVQQELKTVLKCPVNESEGYECTIQPGPKGDKGDMGESGQKGENGTDGSKGLKGDTGSPGTPGPQGERGQLGYPGYKGCQGDIGLKGSIGQKGDVGPVGPRGPKGRTGDQGVKGAVGPRGAKGTIGYPGFKGDRGDLGSAVYARWGRTECPEGSRTVYTGRAAGSHYNTKGATNEFLCLPDNPRYGSTVTNSSVYLYGVEWEEWPTSSHVDDNMPCVLCEAQNKTTTYVHPADYDCPSGWHREYSGYMMSSYAARNQKSIICVDENAEVIPGTSSSTDPALIYYLSVYCSSSELDCSSSKYVESRILSCAVCSK